MDTLIELAIALVVKFWPIILAFFGVKMLGQMKGAAKKKPSVRRPPILTPVHGGGIEPPRPGRAIVERERGEEWEEETLATQDSRGYAESMQPVRPDPPAPTYAASAVAVRQTEAAPAQSEMSVREGMKWALIFSPPRAKDPYRPPVYQNKE